MWKLVLAALMAVATSATIMAPESTRVIVIPLLEPGPDIGAKLEILNRFVGSCLVGEDTESPKKRSSIYMLLADSVEHCISQPDGCAKLQLNASDVTAQTKFRNLREKLRYRLQMGAAANTNPNSLVLLLTDVGCRNLSLYPDAADLLGSGFDQTVDTAAHFRIPILVIFLNEDLYGRRNRLACAAPRSRHDRPVGGSFLHLEYLPFRKLAGAGQICDREY